MYIHVYQLSASQKMYMFILEVIFHENRQCMVSRWAVNEDVEISHVEKNVTYNSYLYIKKVFCGEKLAKK